MFGLSGLSVGLLCGDQTLTVVVAHRLWSQHLDTIQSEQHSLKCR